MKHFCFVFFLTVLSPAAWAGSSACVVYVDSSGSAQSSCDGADLKDLFASSGMSSAISKAIPHFVDLGYTFVGCTDSYSEGPNGSGTAYSRCTFVKK
jgi:hypothetical protein